MSPRSKKRQPREESSRVFFLGAGASRDANVPLTSELLQKVDRNLRNIKGTDFTGKRLKQFIELFGKQKKQNRLPIVEVINLLDTCLRDGTPLAEEFTIRNLQLIRQRLDWEIANVIATAATGGYPVEIPKNLKSYFDERKLEEYFRTFVRGLKRRKLLENTKTLTKTLRGPGDSIITTNYDTLSDLALFEFAYKKDTPLTDIFLGAHFRDPDDNDAFSEPTETIDLLHLHGSLNWLCCSRCGRIFVSALDDNVRDLGPLRHVEWDIKKLKKVERDELTCYCGFSPLEAALIAPSSYQEIRLPQLRQVWLHAHLVLEESSEWWFVGYSLPSEDTAIRALLFRALDSRKSRSVAVKVIGPICPEEKERYESFFKNQVKTLHFDGRGFREYLETEWQT